MQKKMKWFIGGSIILLIICLSYPAMMLYSRFKASETPTATSEPNKRMQDLKEAKEINPDVFAWLEIGGTNINYPVVKTDNNDFYLNHDYKKESDKLGAIFLDKSFDLSKPSTNYLLYGHRNKQGKMFEDLLKYKDESFYKKHPVVSFTTLDGDFEYDIIAIFYSRVYFKREKNVFRYYYFIDAADKTEFDNYVANSKKDSIYDTGKTAEYGDQLLTLSTCEYSQEDGRFVVVARKVK